MLRQFWGTASLKQEFSAQSYTLSKQRTDIKHARVYSFKAPKKTDLVHNETAGPWCQRRALSLPGSVNTDAVNTRVVHPYLQNRFPLPQWLKQMCCEGWAGCQLTHSSGWIVYKTDWLLHSSIREHLLHHKQLKILELYDPAILPLRIYPEEFNHTQEETCVHSCSQHH